MTDTKTLDPTVLAQFRGSETVYRHGLVRSITFTEGAKYVADNAGNGAYWLLDEIALSNKFEKTIMAEEFQVWKLKLHEGEHSATLSVEDGNDNEVFSKELTFTDFPLPEFTLWFTGNVILLPSEY